MKVDGGEKHAERDSIESKGDIRRVGAFLEERQNV